MSRSRQPRITRTAISPRLATSSFLNMRAVSYVARPLPPSCVTMVVSDHQYVESGEPVTEHLTQAAIASSLRGGFGSPLRFFDEIGSTNTEALAWARQG